MVLEREGMYERETATGWWFTKGRTQGETLFYIYIT